MNGGRNATEPHVTRIWVIRSGKGSKAHDLFLAEGVIALADATIGDLAKLKGSRDTFYDAYRKSHPEDTKYGVTGIGGKFFRFMHEVRVGDLAVYPALQDKTVYIGSILSDYAFDMKSPFPHRRLVRWKFMIPKSEFSQASRYELGAARTFFEFKRNADELLSMIADNKVTRFRSKSPSGKNLNQENRVVIGADS
jgi:restriction system protein